MAEKMFNTGKIVGMHGIRGEVKVVRISDFEERFDIGKKLYAVLEGKEPVPLTVDGHRTHKNFNLLHFEGYDNINDVEKLKNAYLKITEAQLTDLAENEYYYHEIIDCEVYTRSGDYIGSIKEILTPGANDVWVVKRGKEKDILIPYIEPVVISIDVLAKKVIIDPMEGLLD